MTINELIEKHRLEIIPDYHKETALSLLGDFAIELLEMMRKAGSFHSNPGMGGICTVEAINKALEELSK